MKLNVYFLGASGVGKTTLARHVVARHGNSLITGSTATAAQRVGDPMQQLGNIEALDAYQAEVWRCQLEAEEPFWRDEQRSFVSDRGPDMLAYTAKWSRIAWQIARSEAFAAYMSRIRQSGRAVCFFVRPTSETLKKAAAEGRREYFLDPEWQHGVDGVVEFLLESHEIPYISIASARLKDRIRTVDTVLDLAKRI